MSDTSELVKAIVDLQKNVNDNVDKLRKDVHEVVKIQVKNSEKIDSLVERLGESRKQAEDFDKRITMLERSRLLVIGGAAGITLITSTIFSKLFTMLGKG